MYPDKMPDNNPPRWAKFAILPNPSKSKKPVNPTSNQTNIKIYIAGGNENLLILKKVSETKQYPRSPYTTPDNPPNKDGPEKEYCK